jgi:hypothetical protein
MLIQCSRFIHYNCSLKEHDSEYDEQVLHYKTMRASANALINAVSLFFKKVASLTARCGEVSTLLASHSSDADITRHAATRALATECVTVHRALKKTRVRREYTAILRARVRITLIYSHAV